MQLYDWEAGFEIVLAAEIDADAINHWAGVKLECRRVTFAKQTGNTFVSNEQFVEEREEGKEKKWTTFFHREKKIRTRSISFANAPPTRPSDVHN